MTIHGRDLSAEEVERLFAEAGLEDVTWSLVDADRSVSELTAIGSTLIEAGLPAPFDSYVDVEENAVVILGPDPERLRRFVDVALGTDPIRGAVIVREGPISEAHATIGGG